MMTKLTYLDKPELNGYVNLNQIVFINFKEYHNSIKPEKFLGCTLAFPSTNGNHYSAMVINYDKYKSIVDDIVNGNQVSEIFAEVNYY